MCRPVIAKKVAPKSGVGGIPSTVVNAFTQCSGRKNGCRPSWIKCLHSIKCRTINATPKNIVAKIHFRAAFLSPRLEADTPNTIVKLDESRQNVITDEKTILG
jgi:hypothetical protein